MHGGGGAQYLRDMSNQPLDRERGVKQRAAPADKQQFFVQVVRARSSSSALGAFRCMRPGALPSASHQALTLWQHRKPSERHSTAVPRLTPSSVHLSHACTPCLCPLWTPCNSASPSWHIPSTHDINGPQPLDRGCWCVRMGAPRGRHGGSPGGDCPPQDSAAAGGGAAEVRGVY